ncbi:NnrU family protein [Consotaella salsifontis]|uniref:Uncharacterized membrane protein n=1 Tax=Consotaella salsifontis TaxID=1365950 RepID=A0A1T4N263_9HYPH|nr:NnrU family protein [Consotaella salsifontis]SJZ73127.1 Uncharacterized membrane protein [Consotaella salsifontis]
MKVLVLGLVLFLGLHSSRIFAAGAREALIRRFGEMSYKGIYSVVSLIGLFLIVWGFGTARANAGLVWQPPVGMRHVALLLVPIALILVVSAYGPTGRIKAAVVHPMVLGVAVWAFGHLLSNGTSADVLLFGAFFIWAVVDYVASLSRSRRSGEYPVAAGVRGDVGAIVIGLIIAALLLGDVHEWLFGVSPLA